MKIIYFHNYLFAQLLFCNVKIKKLDVFKRLYTMIDDDNKVLKYSNKQNMNNIKKEEYRKKINKIERKIRNNRRRKTFM